MAATALLMVVPATGADMPDDEPGAARDSPMTLGSLAEPASEWLGCARQCDRHEQDRDDICAACHRTLLSGHEHLRFPIAGFEADAVGVAVAWLIERGATAADADADAAQAHETRRRLWTAARRESARSCGVPSAGEVADFVRGFSRYELLEEQPLLALVYVNRYLWRTGGALETDTWRPILAVALLVAHKVWVDEGWSNAVLPRVLGVPQALVNRWEAHFLDALRYAVGVDEAEFLSTYAALSDLAGRERRRADADGRSP